MVLFFSVRGEGKCEKKREKKKCFGVNEKE